MNYASDRDCVSSQVVVTARAAVLKLANEHLEKLQRVQHENPAIFGHALEVYRKELRAIRESPSIKKLLHNVQQRHLICKRVKSKEKQSVLTGLLDKCSRSLEAVSQQTSRGNDQLQTHFQQALSNQETMMRMLEQQQWVVNGLASKFGISTLPIETAQGTSTVSVDGATSVVVNQPAQPVQPPKSPVQQPRQPALPVVKGGSRNHLLSTHGELPLRDHYSTLREIYEDWYGVGDPANHFVAHGGIVDLEQKLGSSWRSYSDPRKDGAVQKKISRMRCVMKFVNAMIQWNFDYACGAVSKAQVAAEVLAYLEKKYTALATMEIWVKSQYKEMGCLAVYPLMSCVRVSAVGRLEVKR
jgi:hypothetical protein